MDRRNVIRNQIELLEKVNENLTDDKLYYAELVDEITKVALTIKELVQVHEVITP